MSLLTEEISRLQETMTADLIKHVQQVLHEENQRLLNSTVGQKSPRVGDRFPPFVLPNAYGQLVNSRDLIGQGALIVSFFKGQWSPYCDLELRAFQHFLPEIKSRNAQLAAITPMLPSHCMDIQNKAQLDYEVLSDVGNRLAGELDLSYRLSPKVIDVFEQLGYELPKFNGDQRWELPVPATYLVDNTGTILLAHCNIDNQRRLKPTTIIEVLSTLQ